MPSNSPASARVQQAWDEAALGYDAYFGPRFAPYLGAAVGALLAHEARLPSGALLVPCVGPGRELVPLARAFPTREVRASDLSTSMVSRARERALEYANVSVEQADATRLQRPKAGAAALLSVFGLQLLPDPVAVLGSWLELLNKGGLAVIVLWPREAESAGPFHSMRSLLREAGLADGDWEAQLAPSASAAGARVLADTPLCFEMAHESAAGMWQALTQLGPLRGLLLARGEAFVAALGAQFVAELPRGALVHTPAARLLIIERG
jgi:SAM-dependent methyltransferase